MPAFQARSPSALVVAAMATASLAAEQPQNQSAAQRFLARGLQGDDQRLTVTPDFNSQDCLNEWTNANNNGSFDGFCSRCMNEQGSSPLRSRCFMCFSQCEQLEVCDQDLAGPCRDCVNRDEFCANNDWGPLCMAACCGPTVELPDGCLEACRATRQCDFGDQPAWQMDCPQFRGPRGPDSNSLDCQQSFGDAQRNGQLGVFCDRCATEQGGQPLRARCQLCCDNCGPGAPGANGR